MSSKTALRFVMLVVFATPALSINTNFWEYFYKESATNKTPLDNLRGIDRESFKGNLATASNNLLVLSDTISEVVAAKDRMQMDGGETIKTISSVLEFNDFFLGIKDEEGEVNNTNSSSGSGVSSLFNRTATNSTKNGTKIGTVTKKTPKPDKKRNSQGKQSHLAESHSLEIENSSAEEKVGWHNKVTSWVSSVVKHYHQLAISAFENKRVKKSREFLAKLPGGSDSYLRRLNQAHKQSDGQTSTNSTANGTQPTQAPNTEFSSHPVTRETKAKIDTWAQFFTLEEKGSKALDVMSMNSVRMREAGLKLIKVLGEIPPQF